MDRMYILCALILSFAAQAADIQVVFNKGVNYKLPEKGAKVFLSKGLTIVESDTIKTAKDGFVILRIDNHSIMRIEEGSEVVVNQLPYFYQNSKDLEQGAELELKVGTILIKMIEESQTESMVLKSKNATLGVRGTHFLADASEDLTVSVNEGLVEINNKATKQSDFIESNQSMVVEKGTTFTQRRAYDFQKNIDWNVENKERRTKFRNLRKKLRAEFRKKREKWKKDPKRIAKFKQRWQKRRAQFKERVKNLKPSERRKARQKLRQKIKERRQSKIKNRKLPDFTGKRDQLRKATPKQKEMVKERIKRLREQRQQRRRTGR